MSTVFGEKTRPFTVELTVGSDFKQELEYGIESGGVVGETDWPVGTVLTLVFGNGKAWTATISDELATWAIDKADVLLIPNATDVKCVYTNGTDDRVLFVGVVERRD